MIAMALIICNNCGKKISDTTSECIHCGAKIGFGAKEEFDEPKNVEDVETVAEDEENEIFRFYSLPIEKQEALENEFLEFDTQAAEWQEKAAKVTKFYKISRLFLLLSAIALALLRLIPKIFSIEMFKDDNERAQICLVIGAIGYAVALIISFIAMASCSAVIKARFGKKKQYLYYKRLSNWLMERDVVFDITFLSDSDEKMYNKIDVNVETFEGGKNGNHKVS